MKGDGVTPEMYEAGGEAFEAVLHRTGGDAKENARYVFLSMLEKAPLYEGMHRWAIRRDFDEHLAEQEEAEKSIPEGAPLQSIPIVNGECSICGWKPSRSPQPPTPVAWLFTVDKPGEFTHFASVGEDDASWWPVDNKRYVHRTPLAPCGPMVELVKDYKWVDPTNPWRMPKPEVPPPSLAEQAKMYVAAKQVAERFTQDNEWERRAGLTEAVYRAILGTHHGE